MTYGIGFARFQILHNFDKSGDGMLDPREFISEMKNLFLDHIALWENEVRAVVRSAFDEIDQKSRGVQSQGYLDLIELCTWLSTPSTRSRDQV